MARYMILVEERGSSLPPEETDALLGRRAAYEEELRAGAAFLDGERLRPGIEARRVGRGGVVEERAANDPFLGSYYVVEAPSLDVAVELARECPVPPGGELEVRP
jgi:hypothetical protein